MQQNKPEELVILELDAINRHDIEAFSAVYHSVGSAYDPQVKFHLRIMKQLKNYRTFFKVFPEIKAEVISPIIINKNTAAFETIMEGIHK